MLTGLTVAQFFPQSPIIVTGGNPQSGNTEAGQMRKMLLLLGFPDNRIIVEDKANSTVQNAQFSVPLAKQARHVGHHPGDVDDASRPCRWGLRRRGRQPVSYPDGNPTVNVVQFARDAISPFVSVGYAADIMLPGHMPDAYEATITSIHDFAASL